MWTLGKHGKKTPHGWYPKLRIEQPTLELLGGNDTYCITIPNNTLTTFCKQANYNVRGAE